MENTNAQEKTEEGEIDKVAEELNVGLPHVKLPTPIRLITLFTLIGGLSILGSVFADVVRPNTEEFGFYILRLFIGILAVATAYGIEQKKRWSLWLYGIIVVIGFFTNPLVTILPLLIFIYLYKRRKLFARSALDKIIHFLAFSIKLFFKKKK
ncbi:hypothetical protein C4565_04195 [Candidatus Parcubacteria bacterium]|jgi:small-conductance mechanosensitive channel|nr:MAG: hypothetical protein C4565_04195 [Candidatus Parcubacteria bacterium]